MLQLNDGVENIRGIGDKKKERLNSMGLFTVGDLLNHYPVRYRDRRRAVAAASAGEDRDVLVCGRLLRISSKQLNGRRTVIECTFRDESTTFNAVFFNRPYLKQTLETGYEYALFGKMKLRTGMRIWTNPDIVPAGSENDRREILPVYRCTSGISNNDLVKWVRTALVGTDLSREWIDPDIVSKNRLCSEEYAYKNIHFPADSARYKAARYRSIYEQLLIYQLAVRLNRRDNDNSTMDSSVEDVDISEFIDSLPFRLTEGQLTCIREIEKDMVSRRPMNRLVQGDVGCGKTVVAEAAIYKCVKSGHQAVMMAPTEILARQHFSRLSEDFGRMGISCCLLVSGLKSSERRDILAGISSGNIDVVVGTHAVIQDDVEFNDLALVITDEQHRFGVNQRKCLVNKGRAANVCVMSATPIPRTLAATVFGDMDFSIIKGKPAERKEIITRCVDASGRGRAYKAVLDEVSEGHKAYIIAPSIESDDDELASVEKLYDEMKRKFSDYRVGLIHGKLSKEDKEAVMDDFAEGRLDILVATVVIEVGIDVPDATVIVIENAERFGLAQMHQLRGRVGRSSLQSYCWLVNYSRSEVALARARAMTEMSDGFDISEEDFRLRGPGDISGTMQSGNYQSQIISLCNYTDILELAITDADSIISVPGATDLNYVREYIGRQNTVDNSNIL